MLPADVLAVTERVVALRRDFHQHPELGFEEVRTAGVVAQRLTALGLSPRSGVGRTGVTAVIAGQAGPGPTVLLRADMDALPVTEETDVPFRSTVPGKMHACGHDGHTAVLLGAAEVLAGRRAHLRGHVKLAFQPNEESVQGAAAMLADGVMDDPAVTAAFGLHLWTGTPVGHVALASGPVMASADKLEITIRGRGGHAAFPSDTVDPVVVAAHVITALQTIVSRNVAPAETAVVSITQVLAGEAHNVIPEEAHLVGTIRAFVPAVMQRLRQRIREVTCGVAAALGAEATVTILEGPPAVRNDSEMTDLARSACAAVVGADKVIPFEPVMGGEDFALFAERVPACFLFVGARNEAIACDKPHHHPKFKIDEASLPVAVGAFCAIVERLLG